MSIQTLPIDRQLLIDRYERAYKSLDKIAAALDFLSRIAETDSDQKLELETEHRIGLAALFSILSDQLSDNLYDRLPTPNVISKLCGGKGGQSND